MTPVTLLMYFYFRCFSLCYFDGGQGWLIRRLFEVWTLFTLEVLRMQVASPQLSMHGSNIACLDGSLTWLAVACLEASIEQQATFRLGWHIL